MNKKVKHGTLLTVIFTLLSLLYLYPIILVFINSFKKIAREGTVQSGENVGTVSEFD